MREVPTRRSSPGGTRYVGYHGACLYQNERCRDAGYMLMNPSGGVGLVNVAVYTATCDASAADQAAARARSYAEARHWNVTAVHADPDPAVPLADRQGWQAVTDALSSGSLRGIIVGVAGHVADDAAQFAAPPRQGPWSARSSSWSAEMVMGCSPVPSNWTGTGTRCTAWRPPGWRCTRPCGPRRARCPVVGRR